MKIKYDKNQINILENREGRTNLKVIKVIIMIFFYNYY